MAFEKFMFDRSFDVGGAEPAKVEVEEISEEEEPEIVEPSFSEQELEAAKQEAFAQGKEEALKESATAIEKQMVDMTQSIGEKLDGLIVGQLIANKDIFSDAISVSQAITKKAFPCLGIEQGMKEVEFIIRDILTQVLEEPRVIIHVHPNLEELLRQRIEQISADTHFEGRLNLMADEAVAEGDCKIEWSNGGADRNLQELLAQADTIIETNLSSLEGGYVPSPDALDPEALEEDRKAQAANRESSAPTEPETASHEDEIDASDAQIQIPAEDTEATPTAETTTERPAASSQPDSGIMDTQAQNPAPEPEPPTPVIDGDNEDSENAPS